METSKESTSKDLLQVDKLTEKNYNIWKVRMEAVLDQREVLGVVKGSEASILALTVEQEEGLTTQEKEERQMMVDRRIKKEKLAKAIILLSISDLQLLHVATLKTAVEMWAKFATLYENQKMGTKLFLRKRLLDLKMEEGTSMHDHIANFQSLYDQLATLGIGSENEEANLTFLNSLPPSYGEFVAIISAFINEETSTVHVTYMLLQEELRRNHNGGDQRSDQCATRSFEASLLANNAKGKGKWVKRGENHEDDRQTGPNDRKKDKHSYCSTYMRIGLASSSAPVVVPHFVAWRNNDPGGMIDDLTNDFKGAIGEEKFITCALSETRRKEREEALQMLETELGLGMVGKEELGIGHRKTENLENLPTTMLPDVNGQAFSWTEVAMKNNCMSSFESNACDKTVDGTSFGIETDGSKEGPVINQNQVPNSSHGGHPLHKFICGDEALKIPFGEPYNLRRPICRGHLNISDSYSLQQVCDDLYTIWDWALTKKLDIAAKHRKHYSVVLVVPETLDSREVKEMLTILLRDLGLHSAVIHQESVATTFGNGVSSACVVNLGAQVTSIICVEDGVALPTTKVILPFGGEDISRCLLWVQRCMRNWPPVDCDPLHNPLDLLMLDKVKEGHCCIKEGEQRAFIELKFHSRGKPTLAFKVTMSALNIPPMGIFYPALLAPEEYVPCSRPWYHNEVEDLMFDEAIHLDTGRRNESVDAGPFMPNQNLYMPVGCNEINPRYSDQIRNRNGEPLVGLAQAVVHSILSTGRMDLQKKLFSGIQMAGGVAITPGLIDAVEERVLQAIPEHESIDTVEVLQPRSDPSTVAWKGGMVLGILDTARDTWIQQEDWIDGGLRVGTSRKYKDSFFLQTHIFWYTSS